MEDWLHSYVEWKGNYVKRGVLFKIFLHEGLLPFITSAGYTIGTPLRTLHAYIVEGLYKNRNKSALESTWNNTYYTGGWIDEDLMHYYHAIDPETWDDFWSAWNDIEEFSLESFRGKDRRIDIQELVWKQLDLENSYQTDILYELMNDYDEQEPEESSKKVDVYLLEATGWGGLRS
jgi:hypothetical protein